MNTVIPAFVGGFMGVVAGFLALIVIIWIVSAAEARRW